MDFNDRGIAEEAERSVTDKGALLLIVSPLCAVENMAKKLVNLELGKEELLKYQKRHREWCALVSETKGKWATLSLRTRGRFT